MIDIHAHIIPGVDDGAPDQCTSLQMLEVARNDGITAMVGAPHADVRYRNDAVSCQRAVDLLVATGLPGPRLYSGCELQLNPESLDAVLSNPRQFTINAGNTLLLELPDQLPLTAVLGAIEILLDHGIRCVLAHPERNVLFQNGTGPAERVAAAGAYLQVTAQSLVGAFGSCAQHSAWSLLKHRLVHVIASDCHGIDSRRPRLSPAYNAINDQFGASTAAVLFVENPRACIMGLPMKCMPAKPFLFWRSRAEPSHITRMS